MTESNTDGDRRSDTQRWLDDLLNEVWQSRLDFYGELIDKVADDRYPSPIMLNMIEDGLPPELYRRYLDVLLGKITESKYPSLDLVRRVQRLTDVPMPGQSQPESQAA